MKPPQGLAVRAELIARTDAVLAAKERGETIVTSDETATSPAMTVTDEMVEAGLARSDVVLGDNAMWHLLPEDVRAILEAALAVAPGAAADGLDAVLAEIEAMGWDWAFSLPDRKGKWRSADQMFCAIGGDGFDGIRTYGPTAIAAAIALRDAIKAGTEGAE